MEIFIGIVVVVLLLIVIGKLKGAPEPSSMSDAAIFQPKFLSYPVAAMSDCDKLVGISAG